MIGNSFLITESCLVDQNMNITDGTNEFISYLCKHKIPFLILTNQSLLSNIQLAKKYKEAGIKAIKPEHFYTSTMAGIDLLLTQVPDKKVAGYIGTSTLKDTLRAGGFAVDLDYADYLFVGTDRHASYNDYCYALRLLKSGAMLLATDFSEVEYKDQTPLIGCGAIAKMLEVASNKKAVLLGMPNPNFPLQATVYLDVDRSSCIFVGAHLDSDIVCGLNAKLTTVILTAAMNDEENLFNSKIKPDYAVETMLGLLR